MEPNKLMEKQLFWMRIAALACVGVLIAVVLVVWVLLPQLTQALDTLNRVGTQLSEIDWTGLAGNIDKLAQSGQDTLSRLDIDSLNQAITDLQKAISPLAKLFG